MTVAIFGNAMKSATPEEVRHLLEFLELRGVNVVLSEELRRELNLRDYPEFPTAAEPIDFALSVGGDGTFLTTASFIGNKSIPIVGINCGHLGFLADVQTRDVDRILDQLIKGQYTIEQRSLLTVRTTPADSGKLGSALIPSPNALNEVAILKQSMSRMISIDTKVNGQFLTTYHADGLIIATPTGSTAYNMSVGGPLMVPQARGIILSPIASHSLGVRPLVIPDDWQLELQVHSRNDNYMISVDGRSQTLSSDVTLQISKAAYTIKVVQVGENSFIQSLKDKLSWG